MDAHGYCRVAAPGLPRGGRAEHLSDGLAAILDLSENSETVRAEFGAHPAGLPTELITGHPGSESVTGWGQGESQDAHAAHTPCWLRKWRAAHAGTPHGKGGVGRLPRRTRPGLEAPHQSGIVIPSKDTYTLDPGAPLATLISPLDSTTIAEATPLEIVLINLVASGRAPTGSVAITA